jgi:hypothetical protein
MIVGNGDIPAEAAALIDVADLVVRFNDCRSTATGGSRTDIVAVCNTGRPAKAMLSSQAWREHPAVQAASEIWSVRDPEKFAALKQPLAVSHPELDDFCDDYTSEFNAFCESSGKRHLVVDKLIHDGVDQALSAYEPAPYVVPSSGMIVITQMLEKHPGDDIVLAGFGHVGWEWHPFAAEKRLVDAFVAAGRLRRLNRYQVMS